MTTLRAELEALNHLRVEILHQLGTREDYQDSTETIRLLDELEAALTTRADEGEAEAVAWPEPAIPKGYPCIMHSAGTDYFTRAQVDDILRRVHPAAQVKVPATAEEALTCVGVFKGAHGLRGLLNASDFWEKQMYGTRLYYGPGIADYLHHGVLRAAVEALDSNPGTQAAGEVGGWLPIETLPQSRHVVLFHPRFGFRNKPRITREFTGIEPRDFADDGYTHWREDFPPPPAKEGE